MHIVLANQWYPLESGWGGVAMWNRAIARALVQMGHRVTVVASRPAEDIPAKQEADGVRVIRMLVRDSYRLRRLPLVGRYVRPIQSLNYSRRVNQALRELHNEEPFDIVEFADVNAEGFFYARDPLTPFVVRCHTPTFVLRRYYTSGEMPYDTAITSWCERDVIRRATGLTAPSGDMAKVIEKDLQLGAGKISVIPNALALEEFLCDDQTPVEHPLTILYVGRLERAKGVQVLAQAIPLVLAHVSARFIFVGEDRPTTNGGSLRAELESQLRQAKALDSVEFAGKVDHARLGDWYRGADICVVPSLLYESFSYTCAQAMAWGKPVVATRIGGIPETVEDGVSGLIVEPGNVEQLAGALVRLAQDAGMRAALGRAGGDKAVREFDARKVAENNLEVYARALNPA